MNLPQPIILHRLNQPVTFKELHENMKKMEAKHPDELVYVRSTQDKAYIEFFLKGKEGVKND